MLYIGTSRPVCFVILCYFIIGPITHTYVVQCNIILVYVCSALSNHYYYYDYCALVYLLLIRGIHHYIKNMRAFIHFESVGGARRSYETVVVTYLCALQSRANYKHIYCVLIVLSNNINVAYHSSLIN